MSDNGWIGVDLDGTLAEYQGWKSIAYIGRVIEPMKQRILNWIAEGKTVKIFTARVQEPDAIPHIKHWLGVNGLPDLEITNVKDFAMIELWDDRCVSIVQNTGVPGILELARHMSTLDQDEITKLMKHIENAYSPAKSE